MFETTIEEDMQTATTDAELESLAIKIYNKFRGEFLEFIENLFFYSILLQGYDNPWNGDA